MREYIKKKSSIQNTQDSFFSIFYILLGVIMGIADSLPGISSSTILVISKQYEFIISIFAKIFSKEFFNDIKKFIVNFHFLSLLKFTKLFNKYYLNFSLSLIFGIIVGLTASFLTIAYFLEEYSQTTLKVISIIMIFVTIYYIYEYREIFFNPIYTMYYLYSLLIFCIVYTCLIYIYRIELNSVLTFLVALLSMIVMLLPGISGSLLLVLFGAYIPLKNAIVSFDYVFLTIYCSGSLLGLIIGLKTIDYLNSHFKIRMKFVLLGIISSSTLFLIYKFLL